MLTSSLHLLVESGPLLMVGSCIMVGISVFMTILAVSNALRQSVGAPVSAVIGDAQRRLRREQAAATGSGLYATALVVLPAFTPLVKQLGLGTMRNDLAQRYAAAGWPGGLDDDELFTMSLLGGVLLGGFLAVMSFVLMQMLDMTGALPVVLPILLLMIGLLLGPGVASGRLDGIAKDRTKSIGRTMPFVLDLLVLTIRAGAALRSAIERVTLDFHGTPVGTEFRATLADLELGMTNRDAFLNLAKRAPIPVVRTFVDDLVQSEELGRPIADTLESLSDRVRTIRVQDAIDTAGRAKVLVLIPGTLILFACLIILFSPFIVKFYYQGSSVS